jgi:quinolinate synthase
MTKTVKAPWTAQALYDKLKSIRVDNPACTYTLERCKHLVPYVNEILELKITLQATILAHSYVHPDILYTVADFTGDSLELSKKAMETESDLIIFPAVRFMAETAKILNPTKTVIDPNPNGGCSLADGVTKKDVLELRKKYPDHTFVCYINTTAEVKAACDISVTSSNVYKIIEILPNDKIVFLPDRLMGENVKEHNRVNGIEKEIVIYDGTCYVHEEFSEEEVDFIRDRFSDVKILAHPECPPNVVQKADFVGSTSKMHQYIKEHADAKHPFMMLTECGLTSRLQVEHPKVEFVGSCMLCRYMKSNSLEQLLQAMKAPKKEQIVEIEENTRLQALKTVEKMLELS